MLMYDQHLYKSPAIDIMGTEDGYYPDCWFFLAIRGWKIAGWGQNPQPLTPLNTLIRSSWPHNGFILKQLGQPQRRIGFSVSFLMLKAPWHALKSFCICKKKKDVYLFFAIDIDIDIVDRIHALWMCAAVLHSTIGVGHGFVMNLDVIFH